MAENTFKYSKERWVQLMTTTSWADMVDLLRRRMTQDQINEFEGYWFPAPSPEEQLAMLKKKADIEVELGKDATATKAEIAALEAQLTPPAPAVVTPDIPTAPVNEPDPPAQG